MDHLSKRDRLDLLDHLVRQALEKLLLEAKAKNYLSPPYGRSPSPSPLISEEDFLLAGGLHGDLKDPEFLFEYGFDPLKIISSFLRWAHPKAVVAREEQKSGAQAYLQQRANHAKLQLDTAEDLQKLLQRFASGLQFGPYSSALSSSSVKVSCRSIKPGFVLFEVSEKSDFSEVAQRVEAPALPRDEPSEESSSEEKEMRSVEVQTTHVILTNLKPSTKYYLRCHYTSSSIQVYEQVEIPETSSTNPMDDDMFASADENALMDGLDESAELKISGRKAQEDIFLTSFGRIYSTGEFWTAPSEQVDDDHVDSDAQSLEQRALHDHSTASVDGDLSNVEHASNSALFYPPVSITCFGQIPLHEIANPYSARILQQRPVDRVPELDEIHLLENGCPSVFALLGELLPTSENDELENFPNLESRLANMLAKCGLFNSLQCSSPIFSQSSVLFSFYDSSRSAVQRLKREELLYKQYRQDLKKYKKKYNALLSRTNDSSKGVTSQDVVSTPHFPPAPTLKRPALLESLQAFLEVLPIEVDFVDEEPLHADADSKLPEKSTVTPCKQIYRSLMLGPDVHVFLLDMRGPPEFESSGEFVGNYLGKEQSMWLESSLRSSNSLWKVVMSGHSLAMVLNETEYIEATESNLPQPTSVEEKITDTLEDKEVEESKETNTAEKSLREESEIEDLVKDKAAESVATISKQVSLHLPDPIHTAKDVQLDETTGYLKYSLQHVLASVEAKLPSASRENFLESDAPVDHMLLVSSGILVISAGSVAKRKNVVYTMKESGSAKDYGIEPNDSHSVATTICPHDRSCLAPAFLCGYRTLTFSTGQYTSRTANTQATTASNEKKKNNADNDFYYCAEIGLGPSIQETRSVATSQNSSFDFQTTIVGDLLYQKSCADSLDALTTAKLLLLPDGTLQVDLLELPVSMNATNSACTISTPVPEAHFGKLISRIKCVAPSQKQEEVE